MIVTEWSELPEDSARDRCSPNLEALEAWLEGTFHFRPLGCYVERDIRGGDKPSAHSHGAATDEGYGEARRDAKHPDVPDRAHALAVVELIIDRCEVFEIDAVHDYVEARIWHADRNAWKPAALGADGKYVDPNMGKASSTWFHFETSLAGWSNATPIADRLAGVAPTQPVTVPDPSSTLEASMTTLLLQHQSDAQRGTPAFTGLLLDGNTLGWPGDGVTGALDLKGGATAVLLWDFITQFATDNPGYDQSRVHPDYVVAGLLTSKATVSAPPPFVRANGGLLAAWHAAAVNDQARS